MNSLPRCFRKVHTQTSTMDFRLHQPLAAQRSSGSTVQRRRRTMLPRHSKAMAIPEGWLWKTGACQYTFTTAWTGHTHSHSNTSIHPPPVETIRRMLAPLRICACFQPHCTLRQMLVRLKDRTPLQQRAGVVYRIPCDTCSKIYIG